MTVNDLMKTLDNVPGSARVYTSDPEGCWLFSKIKNVVVHYDEILNQTWVEFVKSDD